ncbi:MAG: crossover junction endodeoxyribonuclease RuvC [Chloroflexi bacterium]|nr:crossover junction endodeoxyribonuclease RuvC [Chloroflexota bacterium]MDL1918083.1 crossover junction endodeoxyribonuclease RuvC [Chloroflexi bacterium CFX5]RIK53931.1 MAG: crossover junction endodeoxyribonuclease RuvC [Chloroflexota bacterium]
MTLALGIDPGTATTGYGLVRLLPDGELVAVSFGAILTPKADSASARLATLYDALVKLIKKHKPETAAVEKLFFSRNITTGIAVGQARGVVLLALEKAGVETYEYTPNEVKQAVAGYGSAEKRQVQEMVRALLQLDKIPKPDDAADALAIAITHLNTARYA